MTRHVSKKRTDLDLVGVDFAEMIDRAKRESVDYRNITWHSKSIIEFHDQADFNMVISMGSLAAIRYEPHFWQAIDRVSSQLAPGGTLLMVDPLHTFNFLARVKVSSVQVCQYLRARGFDVHQERGMIFWPIREMIANSSLNPKWTKRFYSMGEILLKIPGLERFSDYKTIIASRPG